MIRKIETKKGIAVIGLKPLILQKVGDVFGSKSFLKSDFVTLMKDEGFSSKRASNYLESLTKNQWFSSKKIARGTNKDSRFFTLSGKSIGYVNRFGSFMNPNAPLMKSKEPERVVVEKTIPVEVIKNTRERHIGEL